MTTSDYATETTTHEAWVVTHSDPAGSDSVIVTDRDAAEAAFSATCDTMPDQAMLLRGINADPYEDGDTQRWLATASRMELVRCWYSRHVDDPLGIATSRPRPKCSFGRQHGYCLGFYHRGQWMGGIYSSPAGDYQYLLCSSCGQIEFEEA